MSLLWPCGCDGSDKFEAQSWDRQRVDSWPSPDRLTSALAWPGALVLLSLSLSVDRTRIVSPPSAADRINADCRHERRPIWISKLPLSSRIKAVSHVFTWQPLHNLQRASVSEKKAGVPTDLIRALAGVIGVTSFPSCLCDVTANNVTVGLSKGRCTIQLKLRWKNLVLEKKLLRSLIVCQLQGSIQMLKV